MVALGSVKKNRYSVAVEGSSFFHCCCDCCATVRMNHNFFTKGMISSCFSPFHCKICSITMEALKTISSFLVTFTKKISRFRFYC